MRVSIGLFLRAVVRFSCPSGFVSQCDAVVVGSALRNFLSCYCLLFGLVVLSLVPWPRRRVFFLRPCVQSVIAFLVIGAGPPFSFSVSCPTKLFVVQIVAFTFFLSLSRV